MIQTKRLKIKEISFKFTDAFWFLADQHKIQNMKKHALKVIVAVIACSLIFASCATKKKYGCPEHISIQKILGL